MKAHRLSVAEAYLATDPNSLPPNLSPLSEILGQDRAKKAVEFALSVPNKGYNIFAIGDNGLGKRTMMLRYLRQREALSGEVFDWCYVANFEHSRHPNVLCLPRGRANGFKKCVEQAVRELVKALPLAFDNEWYFRRAEQLKVGLTEQQSQRLERLTAYAKKHRVVLQLTEQGNYQLIALQENSDPHTEATFDALSFEAQNAFEQTIARIEVKLRNMVRKLAETEAKYLEKLQLLNEEVASEVMARTLDDLVTNYQDLPQVQSHITEMKADILNHLDLFVDDDPDNSGLTDGIWNRKMPPRYQVNVISAFDSDAPFPIIVEENPSYHTLFGDIEKATLQGTVFSDFTLIRAGSLHLANGGVLLMDAIKVLERPFVWDGLKRALRSQKLNLTALDQEISLSGNVSLEPNPIPLNVKIVLFGDRRTYQLLQHYDAEFSELFRITAHFDDQMPRAADSERQYAQFLVGIMREHEFLPCDPSALARVIEYGARQAQDRYKLSLHSAQIANLLRESHYVATQRSAECVTQRDIETVLAAQCARVDRDQQLALEAVSEKQWLLSLSGQAVGQINGLSVVGTQDHQFGLVNRITATAWRGDGCVLDIERQVNLGGALHSKGVSIVTSYLKQFLGRNRTLSMNIALTFEQSYGEIDGDSASLAECCAILSCLSGVPISQRFAVTGSLNQAGEVQPIGGINEKIEGLVAVSEALSITSPFGAIFPMGNGRHLMLNDATRRKMATEQFELYGVNRLEEAIPLLFGQSLSALIVAIHRRWRLPKYLNPAGRSR